MRNALLNTLRLTPPKGIQIIDKGSHCPTLHINNPHATADIALNGAHVFHYQPKDQAPVLWLSDTAAFEKGRAIRGGIPICWPWFGDHATNQQLPAHGFARSDTFELINVEANANQETVVTLQLQSNAFNQQYWDSLFTLDVTITVGESLDVSMTMRNDDSSSHTFSSALHSYFTISDVTKVAIKGLDETPYYDKLQNFNAAIQHGSITLDREIDRVYVPTTNEVYIDDEGLNRTINITKTGSASTVVWNPWIDKSALMNDFHEGGYRCMVCVETTNTREDSMTLKSGESHTISTNIASQPH